MPEPSTLSESGTADILRKTQALAEADLRAAAVRVTAARVKVLAALLSARCALAHQDIQACIKIDRVTLYRVLASLIDAGLAHKISGEDRVSRFSPSSEPGRRKQESLPSQTPHQKQNGQHRHGHFQCTRCTRVFCLDHSRESGLLDEIFPSSNKGRQNVAPEPLQQILQKTLEAGFQSHDIELIVKGWCAECAR